MGRVGPIVDPTDRIQFDPNYETIRRVGKTARTVRAAIEWNRRVDPVELVEYGKEPETTLRRSGSRSPIASRNVVESR